MSETYAIEYESIPANHEMLGDMIYILEDRGYAQVDGDGELWYGDYSLTPDRLIWRLKLGDLYKDLCRII